MSLAYIIGKNWKHQLGLKCFKTLFCRFSSYWFIFISLVNNCRKILWRNRSWLDIISDPSLLGGSVESWQSRNAGSGSSSLHPDWGPLHLHSWSLCGLETPVPHWGQYRPSLHPLCLVHTRISGLSCLQIQVWSCRSLTGMAWKEKWLSEVLQRRPGRHECIWCESFKVMETVHWSKSL